MRAAVRMGGDRVTVRNLKVAKVDPENNLLIVRGAIPARRPLRGYSQAITAKRIKVAQAGSPRGRNNSLAILN